MTLYQRSEVIVTDNSSQIKLTMTNKIFAAGFQSFTFLLSQISVTHLKIPTVCLFFFLAFLFFSLLHFLATLNTTSSSPSSQSQKVPARQETSSSSATDVKAGKQLMVTKVSLETNQSKYQKATTSKIYLKLKIAFSFPLQSQTNCSH